MFVMVDVDKNITTAEKFMKRRNFNLPAFVPAETIPASIFNKSIPVTIVIDKTGKIVFRHQNMANYLTPEFESFLLKLAKE